MNRRFLLAAAALAALAPAALAHDFTLGQLFIGHPYAPATPGAARTGAAYLSIENRGTAADRLLAAATPAADKTELHTHIMDGNVARMRQVVAIDIAAGGKVELKPGGLHVMLIGLKQPLRDGDKFPLTLTFEKAGAVTVEIAVQQRRATGGHSGH